MLNCFIYTAESRASAITRVRIKITLNQYPYHLSSFSHVTCIVVGYMQGRSKDLGGGPRIFFQI